VRKLEEYGVEARGIERVPESDRRGGGGRGWQGAALERCALAEWLAMTMWGAANTTVATYALGTYVAPCRAMLKSSLGASIWNLDLRTSILTIVFFNLLSTLPVATFSVWGARTGLRQMCLGRYSWGMVAVWAPTLLNLVACVGWASINAIAGASALHAVGSNHKLPEVAGIVIITGVTAIVSIAGCACSAASTRADLADRAVHLFELASLAPVAIVFFITLGLSAQCVTDPLRRR